MNTTRDLFEAEAVKAIVDKLLDENSLGGQQRLILKYLVENPSSFTHEIRQACSSGHPTLRMREIADLLLEYGLRIPGKPAPKVPMIAQRRGWQAAIHCVTLVLPLVPVTETSDRRSLGRP